MREQRSNGVEQIPVPLWTRKEKEVSAAVCPRDFVLRRRQLNTDRAFRGQLRWCASCWERKFAVMRWLFAGRQPPSKERVRALSSAIKLRWRVHFIATGTESRLSKSYAFFLFSHQLSKFECFYQTSGQFHIQWCTRLYRSWFSHLRERKAWYRHLGIPFFAIEFRTQFSHTWEDSVSLLCTCSTNLSSRHSSYLHTLGINPFTSRNQGNKSGAYMNEWSW